LWLILTSETVDRPVSELLHSTLWPITAHKVTQTGVENSDAIYLTVTNVVVDVTRQLLSLHCKCSHSQKL